MARRRCNTTQDTIEVCFRDRKRGESVSITVYGAQLLGVATVAQVALGNRWRTTKLTDRRHKRRL